MERGGLLRIWIMLHNWVKYGRRYFRDLAHSMLRMWGKQAKNLAREYACDFENRNVCIEAAKWFDVERVVDRYLSLAETYRSTTG